ncbi:MAG: dihydroorotate dehydrogenase electron transfer subunit [Ignavibacteria bacterium]|nr:dihydroorotate dehydrogenase electron transfer subunit [Ignavibacteria bacterium]
MIQTCAQLIDKKLVTDEIFLLQFHSAEIAQIAQPGQFVNVRVCDALNPYLRRPFSICDVEGENFSLLFNILGMGTKMLATAEVGEKFDFIGPLGNGFNLNSDLDLAIIVAGGMGIAPFPFLTNRIDSRIEIKTFIGAKSKENIITYKMKNFEIATDDGSLGAKMNVVELFMEFYSKNKLPAKAKVFGCGPTIMLIALAEFCLRNNLDCEVSTECAMACGFGICQGCPIEASNREEYLLVCKDGPIFNVRDIVL